MLKKIECVFVMLMDLVAPCVLILFALSAYDCFIDGDMLRGATCIVGATIPTACIYTRHLREDDYIEYDEEETKEKGSN